MKNILLQCSSFIEIYGYNLLSTSSYNVSLIVAQFLLQVFSNVVLLAVINFKKSKYIRKR